MKLMNYLFELKLGSRFFKLDSVQHSARIYISSSELIGGWGESSLWEIIFFLKKWKHLAICFYFIATLHCYSFPFSCYRLPFFQTYHAGHDWLPFACHVHIHQTYLLAFHNLETYSLNSARAIPPSSLSTLLNIYVCMYVCVCPRDLLNNQGLLDVNAIQLWGNEYI